MSSSIVSSKLGQVSPFKRSVSCQTKCCSGPHEPLNRHNGRKRHRSGSLEHGRGDENVKIDTISSMSATIETLKHQVSCLQQLLRDAYTPLHMASIPHTCPAISCKKPFKRLEHLYRHIREQNDPAHEPLAGLINETRCLVCSKNLKRPQDLVKHEKKAHGELYISRLDKFLGTSLPLSPSSTSVAVDDATSR